MPRVLLSLAPLAALAILTASCSGADSAPPGPTATSRPRPTIPIPTVRTVDPARLGEGLARIVDRLGLDPTQKQCALDRAGNDPATTDERERLSRLLRHAVDCGGQPALAKTLVDQVSTDLTLTDQQRTCAQDQLSQTTPDQLIAALNGDPDAINTIETTIKTTCNISSSPAGFASPAG